MADTARPGTPDPRDLPRIRELRRRAYEELNAAIDKAGGDLPGDWLTAGDPDLQPLRDLGEPEWHVLVRRHTGTTSRDDPKFPEPAWGDPHRRRNEWIGLAAVWLALAAVVVAMFFPGRALLGLAVTAVALVATAVFVPRRRRWLAVAAILVAGVVAGVLLYPIGATLVAAGFVLAAGASLLSAAIVHNEARIADKRSIELRRQHMDHDRDPKAP
jgi:hypothetical protein